MPEEMAGGKPKYNQKNQQKKKRGERGGRKRGTKSNWASGAAGFGVFLFFRVLPKTTSSTIPIFFCVPIFFSAKQKIKIEQKKLQPAPPPPTRHTAKQRTEHQKT